MPDPAAPAPAPAPAPTPVPAPAPAPAPTAWHGFTEPDAVSYVDNKGWKTPADIVASYKGAEKLIGQDPSTLLKMPRADDPAGFRAVFSKLGMPETPDKYEIAMPQSGVRPDDGYLAWARGAFHKAGLTNDQVKGLTAEHNAYVNGVVAQQEKDYNLSVDTDKKALLAEWKGGHERMVNAAQTAAKALGFTPEMIDGIERSAGYAGTWKFFAALGQKMGEDGFVSSGVKEGFNNATMTPAEAKGAWESMKLDPAAIAALKDSMHPGHKAAREKQNSLFKIMYPE